MRRRTDTQRDGLERRALYSVAALARIANVSRFMLTRLLRANSVQFVVAGRARYVPLVEIRDKIPPLFESLRASEEVRRMDEAETDVEMPTQITTGRLVLRPFQSDDVEDALAYRDDLEFARFLPHISQPFMRADAEAMVATNMTEPWDRSPTFAVVFEGRVIGTVNFEVDVTTHTAMIGYAIGRAWWGRGIATEAARAAMAWAIETFDLVRMWASTELGNVRSQRVLEKLGMRREGLRTADHVGRDGKEVDEVVYGLDVAAMSRP